MNRFRVPPLPALSGPVLLGVACLVATGCGKKAAAAGNRRRPKSGSSRSHPENAPLTRDLVGRLSAYRTSDVRARVAGVLIKRVYQEGSDVKEGQLLFEIDPAPLQAALNANLASLAQAQATYTNNHIAAQRARDLVPKGFVSKADVDNAEAAERTAAASVKQAQANVETLAHQPRLRQRARADRRTRRQAAGDRRRAGRPERRDAADDDRPGRSDLREFHAQRDRSRIDAPRADVGASDALRDRQGRDPARAPGRHRIRRERHARFLRHDGRSRDRRGEPARTDPERGPQSPARHVRLDQGDARPAARRVQGAAARAAARCIGRVRARRRLRRQDRAQERQGRRRARRQLDRHGWSRGRRSGRRLRHPACEGRSAREGRRHGSRRHRTRMPAAQRVRRPTRSPRHRTTRSPTRRPSSRTSSKAAAHVQILHRPPDLRLGDRDPDHALAA